MEAVLDFYVSYNFLSLSLSLALISVLYPTINNANNSPPVGDFLVHILITRHISESRK